MREFSDRVRASLARGATQLCTCWRIIRRDGVTMGFTDHDRDIVSQGVTYAAASGLEGAAFETVQGFAVGGSEAAGALSAVGLSEDDLANGLYDGARVEIRRVDWSAPDLAVLLDVAESAPSARNCARSPMRSIRSAGASIARNATPISATCAAASSSRASPSWWSAPRLRIARPICCG